MADLNELWVFSKVVEKSSFTAAADALGLTKSTVSRRVAELEQRLNCRLLTRTTRQLNVTAAGAQLYAQCQAALLVLQEAEQQLVSSLDEVQGLLKVVSPIEFGQLFLADLVAQFMHQHPQLMVELEFSNRKTNLIDEEVDVMFRIELGDDSSMIAKPIVSSYGTMVAAPIVAERYQHLAGPDLIPAEQVMLVQGPHTSKQWQMRMGERIVELSTNHRIQCNSISAVRTMTLAGHGVSLLPDFLVQQDIEQGKLVPLFLEWQTRSHCIYAIYPSRRFMPAKLRLFLDFVTEAMQKRSREFYQHNTESHQHWSPILKHRYKTNIPLVLR